MSTVSWFVTMRIVDWTVWKHKIAIAAYLLYFIVSGIHPAAVKCPVSASVVGRSSQVKLSVRSIARSILCSRNLTQRNQTVISGSLNVENFQRTAGIFGSHVTMNLFVNKILKVLLYILSGVEAFTVFGVKYCYIFNVQVILSVISKSAIWTIHLICSGTSLSQ